MYVRTVFFSLSVLQQTSFYSFEELLNLKKVAGAENTLSPYFEKQTEFYCIECCCAVLRITGGGLEEDNVSGNNPCN
jgi:hypothetical protein